MVTSIFRPNMMVSLLTETNVAVFNVAHRQ